MAKVLWESQKELEDYVFNFIIKNSQNPINGNSVDGVYRQVELGSYGIADLITFSYENHFLYISIIELKKEVIDIKTMAQLSRYHKAVSKYFEKYHPECSIRISLLAVSTDINQNDDSVWLSDYLFINNDFDVFLCDFDLDSGVSFSRTGRWYKKNEEFDKFNKTIGQIEVNSFMSFGEAAVKADTEISKIFSDNNG